MTAPDDTAEGVTSHDFDAFWAAHGQRQTVRILGEDVPLPTDVPMWLVLRAEGAPVQDAAEVRRMVSTLYGDDQLDRWTEQGLGMRQLSVILAWTVARAQGAGISFAEAADRVERVMSDPPAPRPGPNRQQRRGNRTKRKR